MLFLPLAKPPLRAYIAAMHRYRRKLIILVVLLAIGAVAWHFDLFRAGDCLREGGKWNADGGFCRLDRLAIPPQMQGQ